MQPAYWRPMGSVPEGWSWVQVGTSPSDSAHTSLNWGPVSWPPAEPPPKRTMRSRTGSKIATWPQRNDGGVPTAWSFDQAMDASDNDQITFVLELSYAKSTRRSRGES